MFQQKVMIIRTVKKENLNVQKSQNSRTNLQSVVEEGVDVEDEGEQSIKFRALMWNYTAMIDKQIHDASSIGDQTANNFDVDYQYLELIINSYNEASNHE